MYAVILMIHVFIAVVLVGLVLMQHGKGADIGAAFGSGASSTVFGSQGGGSFLFKSTGILALCFFLTSLILSYMVSAPYAKHVANTSSNVPVPVNTSDVPAPMPAVQPQQGTTDIPVPVK